VSQLILPPPPNTDNLLLDSRRKFLKLAAGTIASMALPCFAQSNDFWNLPRELWLRRPDTGEELRAVYWADGAIVNEGYFQICRLLRDTHLNLAVQYDLVTLDIARGVFGWLQGFGIQRPIIVNSGYRHPTTNASEGGVKNSLHTLAQALDIRIDGVSTDSVTRFGQYLSGGGVGFYPGKNFTHLDRGRVRYWQG
jgi:uncharacterized protein YcbK (DUF882 family)